jgi:hypothetical protein
VALESPTYRRVSLPSIGRTQRAALCRSHRTPRLFGTLSSGLSLRLRWRATLSDLPSNLWQASVPRVPVKGTLLCRWFVIAVRRGACLNQTPQDQRSPAVRRVRLSHLPRIVAAPATARYNGRPVPKSLPNAPNAMMIDPADLVARALTIIAEETQAWQVRQDIPPRESPP